MLAIPASLSQAFEAQLNANGGAPGVDGMSVDAFAGHARQHWPGIAGKLQTGDYQPGAIRGVSIPKAQGGERILGILNVQDHVIQQALSQVLSPIFEAQFSAHSYCAQPDDQRSEKSAGFLSKSLAAMRQFAVSGQ